MIVVGKNSDKICVVESIDLESDKIQRLYTAPDSERGYKNVYTEAENGFVKVVYKESYNNKSSKEDLYNSIFVAIKADDFTLFEKTLECSSNYTTSPDLEDFYITDEYLYYYFGIWDKDTGRHKDETEWKINLSDGETETITYEEFEAAEYMDMQEEWKYYVEGNYIKRQNKKQQVESVYGIGNIKKTILYVKDDMVVFSVSPNVYIIDGDGSNLRQIAGDSTNNSSNTTGSNSNNLSGFSNNSSTGGARIEPTKPCGLCGGTGQMKCNMCGGDGMMPSLTIVGVGGGNFEESCRYCSGGRKQCLACGGDGVIQ